VLEIADGQTPWRTRLAKDSPVIGAELVWAVRHEMAITLCDAVVRRTPLGALGFPGDAAVERAAAIVSAERRWTPERTAKEVDALKRFYEVRP
jgi:glycerol-3-phosphate dehydrogenase